MNRTMPESDSIAALIRSVRGHKVILDSDLAALYGMPTKRFNEAIKRNADRFPEDFRFQLTQEEFDALRSQTATSKSGRGGRRYLPQCFTEHGALMAANVLNSERAVLTSIAVVRAFLHLRSMALSVEQLTRKVAALESRYDEQFKIVFDAIRQLISPPDPPRKAIGFHSTDRA
jgi:hypothetical protein